MKPSTLQALKNAEAFISGFEDDECQEDMTALDEVRAAIKEAEEKPKPQVHFEMITMQDLHADRPDEMQDGFWPSLDPKDAGWIGNKSEEELAMAKTEAEERMKAWVRGDWYYMGVKAKAKIFIPLPGNNCTVFYELESPGLWGIESDSSPEYLKEVFSEQCEELKDAIEAMSNAEFNGATC